MAQGSDRDLVCEGAGMVRDRGFEPLTPSVSRKCSTPELTAQPAAYQALTHVLKILVLEAKAP